MEMDKNQRKEGGGFKVLSGLQAHALPFLSECVAKTKRNVFIH